MDFLSVKTIEEAQDILKQMAESQTPRREEVPLEKALGKVLAHDVYAQENLPSFNRSTVDGYAVYCQDVFGASESIPAILQMKGSVDMGCEAPKALNSGECVYVPTGGMLPEHTEAMVMIEYAEKLEEETILIYKPASHGQNISYAGDDVGQGEKILGQGRKLSAYDIGILAAMNLAKVSVVLSPQVAILSTGDEVVDVGQSLKPGQIYDINGYALGGLIESYGAHLVYKKIVIDDFDLLKETMDEALKESEIILLSGGSSVGAKDYTKKLIESYEDGDVFVHGLGIKPGKPTILGRIGQKPIFGLPGHPVSALMVCQQTVKIYLSHLMGKEERPIYLWATLSGNVHSSPGKTTYQIVSLREEGQDWIAEPLYGKSGMIHLLTEGMGYFEIEKDREGYHQGERIRVYPLREGSL